MYLGNTRFTVRPDKGCHALNAVGGRVFQLKTRTRACACGTRGAPEPRPGGMLVLRAWEVWMDAGRSRTPMGVRALGCWLGASPSQGHVASPDLSQSGERVRGRWPGEVRA